MLKSNISNQLHQHINGFLDHCRSRCFSEGTIEGYRSNLRQFVSRLGDYAAKHKVADFQTACTEIVMMETITMKQADNPELKATTIRRYICAWRSFIAYLVKANVLDLSYDRFRFDLPKLPETLPKSVDMSVLDKLLDNPQCLPKQPHWMYLRNLCIFELMTYSGLRISEVSNLLMTDVYFAERQIRVIGKGQRTRLVPITDTVAKRIRAYLKERSASAVNIRTNHLFVGRGGKMLRPCSIRLSLHKMVVARLGEEMHITPHSLRHSCATHFVRETHNLRFVQILLGHKSIATTQIYTHLNNGFIQEMFHQHHSR